MSQRAFNFAKNHPFLEIRRPKCILNFTGYLNNSLAIHVSYTAEAKTIASFKLTSGIFMNQGPLSIKNS